VPEAETLVGPLRERHDAAAGAGLPAHITILYPFLPVYRIEFTDLARLSAFFAATPTIAYALTEVRRFPGVVYLAPEPDRPMRELISRLRALYPEYPPYGGKYPEVVPHLTVAQTEEVEVLDEVAAALAGGLPIRCSATEAWLMMEDDQGRWRAGHRFALGRK
jgi:hypothetical protein